MTNHGPTARTYLFTFAWLAVLTAMEIGVVLLGWPRMALVIFLISTALAKATLIGLFFMHLRFDRPWVWLLPAIPVFFAIIFVLALFPDIVWHLTLRM